MGSFQAYPPYSFSGPSNHLRSRRFPITLLRVPTRLAQRALFSEANKVSEGGTLIVMGSRPRDPWLIRILPYEFKAKQSAEGPRRKRALKRNKASSRGQIILQSTCPTMGPGLIGPDFRERHGETSHPVRHPSAPRPPWLAGPTCSRDRRRPTPPGLF